jgi:hypothetical protein
MNINDKLIIVNNNQEEFNINNLRIKLTLVQYIHLLTHLLKAQNSILFNYFYDQIPVEYTQEKVSYCCSCFFVLFFF